MCQQKKQVVRLLTKMSFVYKQKRFLGNVFAQKNKEDKTIVWKLYLQL